MVAGPWGALGGVVIAALVLGPLWTASRAKRSHRPQPRRQGRVRAAWLAVLGGAFFGLDLALYNTAVLMTTATEATLFGNNAPLFVGLGTWLIFRRDDITVDASGRLAINGQALSPPGAVLKTFGSGSFLFRIAP